MKLAAVIDQYMKFRQDLGKGLDKSARDILLSYCRNVGRGMDIAKIRPEQASSFLNGNGPVTSYWHRKHSLLVGFYRYAVSRGQVNCSPLPVLLPKRPGPFSPYLYSRTELRQLLDGTAGFHRNHVKLESHTLRAIVLLLYGAGLRCCEALGLTLMDVDVQQACLTIRHTKFHKTRLVPLGAKLNQAMGKYARRRKRDGHSAEA